MPQPLGNRKFVKLQQGHFGLAFSLPRRLLFDECGPKTSRGTYVPITQVQTLGTVDVCESSM